MKGIEKKEKEKEIEENKGKMEDEKEKTEEKKEKEKEEILKYEEERKKKIEEENVKEKKNFDKYRIDFLSFKTSLPNTKIKSLCPICIEIPNIRLSLNNENEFYIKCESCRYCYCCSRPRSKTLDDYISIMAKINQENIRCDLHKEKGIDKEGFECVNKHIKEKDNENHQYYIIRKANKKDLHTHCPYHNLEEYSYYFKKVCLKYIIVANFA